MMRAILAAALMLALTPSAFAAPCTSANAETTTVQRMLKHTKQFEGRCIRLNGIAAFREFFDDLPSVYAEMTDRDIDAAPRSVKLYSYDDEALGDRLWRAREPMEVIGIGSSCSRMYREAQKQADRENAERKKAAGDGMVQTVTIVFMGGRCHYQGGPVIKVTEANPLPGKARITGEGARKKYGDAFFLASPRDNVRKPVEALIAALRARDMKLLASTIEDDWNEVDKTALLDPAKSPFAFLLGAPRDPQTVYFDTHLHSDQLGTKVIGVACMCRRDDCTGDWPITFSDMNSDDGNVFKCLQVSDDGNIAGI
jgi:hypothetical protein